jgi:beta-D-xylosidase 4
MIHHVGIQYSEMLLANISTAGPALYHNKWLVGFDRLLSIAPGSSATITIPRPHLLRQPRRHTR